MDQFLDHPVLSLSPPPSLPPIHLLPEIFSVTLTSRPSVAAAGFRQLPVPPHYLQGGRNDPHDLQLWRPIEAEIVVAVNVPLFCLCTLSEGQRWKESRPDADWLRSVTFGVQVTGVVGAGLHSIAVCCWTVPLCGCKHGCRRFEGTRRSYLQRLAVYLGTFKIKAACCLLPSGTTCPSTQRHIPADRNLRCTMAAVKCTADLPWSELLLVVCGVWLSVQLVAYDRSMAAPRCV